MRILIVQGHPDPSTPHFCHALAEAYERGASQAGHDIRKIDVATLPLTFLRSQTEWETGEVPDYAREAQDAVLWADHIVVLFPLWMGGMPAVLRAWFEQSFRANFAFETTETGMVRHLKGKSARLVVTMGMPSIFYRWYFGQPGTKLLRRSVLGFAGVSPIRQTLVGMIEKMPAERAGKLMSELEALGRKGR